MRPPAYLFIVVQLPEHKRSIIIHECASLGNILHPTRWRGAARWRSLVEVTVTSTSDTVGNKRQSLGRWKVAGSESATGPTTRWVAGSLVRLPAQRVGSAPPC